MGGGGGGGCYYIKVFIKVDDLYRCYLEFFNYIV